MINKTFQEHHLNSRNFPVFPGAKSNSWSFPGFPGAVNNLNNYFSDSICGVFMEQYGMETHIPV